MKEASYLMLLFLLYAGCLLCASKPKVEIFEDFFIYDRESREVGERVLRIDRATFYALPSDIEEWL